MDILMDNWMYIAPVVFIFAIVLFMMPIMKKKAADATAAMAVMKDMKVHIFMLAGNLKSINGVEESALPQTNSIFAIDQDGTLSVEFTPNFVYHDTVYTGKSPMTITFEAESGKSYEIKAEKKEPKDNPSIIDVSPVVSDELIFKSSFYIVTKDVTDTAQAKGMRGIY